MPWKQLGPIFASTMSSGPGSTSDTMAFGSTVEARGASAGLGFRFQRPYRAGVWWK
ncbi:hypothetical protein GCM10018954_087880 [Kutzneria kofuensis]